MDCVIQNEIFIPNRLSDIDDRLLTYESIISFQKEEIIKTESLISEFQNCLKRQHKALQMFVEEKERVETEINANKLYERELEDITSNVRNKDCQQPNNGEPRMTNFPNQVADPTTIYNEFTNKQMIHLDILEYNGPRRFYETITEVAISFHDEGETKYQLTEIPNSLKVIEDNRQMIIIRNDREAIRPIDEIQHHRLGRAFYLHIGRGQGILTYERNEKIGYHLLKSRTSYNILQSQAVDTIFTLRSEKLFNLAIEILEPLPYDISQPIVTQEEYEWELPTAVRDRKVSSLRKNMSPTEIRNRLVFINVKCATGDEEQKIPINIGAIDYYGNIMMDEVMCPREHIKRYDQKIHGLTEEHLRSKKDNGLVLTLVEQMLRGRIIVGHDLHNAHRALPIHLDQIGGIRDLEGSSAVISFMGTTYSLSLDDLAKRLHIEEQGDTHCAINDAKIIRAIYIKIENRWADTPRHVLQQLHSDVDITAPRARCRLMLRDTLRKDYQAKQCIETSNSPIKNTQVTMSTESTKDPFLAVESTERSVDEDPPAVTAPHPTNRRLRRKRTYGHKDKEQPQ